MAYTYDTYTPAEINAGIADQASRIRHETIEDVMLNDPWSNLFEGGTVEAGNGEEIKTTIPGRVALNQSMTAPLTIRKSASCGASGPKAEFGSQDYTSYMDTIRGEGPLLCVHDQFTKVERALSQMESGLRDGVRELMAADARNNVVVNSGHKMNIVTGGGYSLLTDMLTGGEDQVAVDFPALGLPNAEITHKAIVGVTKHLLTTVRGVKRFGSGAGAHVVFISSPDNIEKMRDESGLKTETLALVQGGDAEATAALKRYSFADYPYRGIRTAEDFRPLRFNAIDGNNYPTFLEPYKRADSDQGTRWIIDPDWVSAAYEVSFLAFAGTFKRNVPSRFVGEGAAKFPAQFVMGELEWLNVRDMTYNKYGDVGQFLYQITRNWEPLAPWAIVPILHKRCAPDYGLTACSTSSESSGD